MPDRKKRWKEKKRKKIELGQGAKLDLGLLAGSKLNVG
jgi:hypothetical protein